MFLFFLYSMCNDCRGPPCRVKVWHILPVPTFLLIDQIDVWLRVIIYRSIRSIVLVGPEISKKAGDCQISKLHLTCWRKKQEKNKLPWSSGKKKTDVVTPSWKWAKLLSCSSLKSFFRSALLVLPWLCDNMSSSWSWTSFQTEQLIIKSHQQEKITRHNFMKICIKQ